MLLRSISEPTKPAGSVSVEVAKGQDLKAKAENLEERVASRVPSSSGMAQWGRGIKEQVK